MLALLQVLWAIFAGGVWALWPAALAVLAGAALARGLRILAWPTLVGLIVAVGAILGATGEGWVVWLRWIEAGLAALVALGLFRALWLGPPPSQA